MKDAYVEEVVAEILKETESSSEGTILLIQTTQGGSVDYQKKGIVRTLKHLGCFETFEWTKKDSMRAIDDSAVFVLSKEGRAILERLHAKE